jgi:L-ascorbate metabolism protein UlaG (beta-lactamase superfamily)
VNIKWLGHAAFLIEGTVPKHGRLRIVTDPYQAGGYDGNVRYAPIREPADIVTVSHEHPDHNDVKQIPGAPIVVRKTGRHEVKGLTIEGILTCHDETSGRQRGLNTVFCFTLDDVRVCHLGDLGHVLAPKELAAIGPVDVLMIPVGGFYTIDAAQASLTVAALKPKLVLPMHYKTEALDFPIAGLEEFLKGKTGVKRLDAAELSVNKDTLPKTTEVWVLKHAL